MFSFAQPWSRYNTVSMGIAELTTLTVLVADSTKLAGWLTACCLACTLSHCGARGVRVLFVGESQRGPIIYKFYLTTFFACLEDSTVLPTRPATKDCGLSFSVADVSKTLKRVNPRKAAGPSLEYPQSMRRPAGWCVYGHIQSLPIPVCCPHMLQGGHHCSCTQEGKGNRT